MKMRDKAVNVKPPSRSPGSVSLTHRVLIPFASLTTGLRELQRSVTNRTLPLIHILLNH